MGIESEATLPVPERISDGLGRIERWEMALSSGVVIEEMVARVCEGERLKEICKSKGWPYSVVARWVAGTPEVFRMYEQALMLAADDMAQETVPISDGATPETAAVDGLRIKARQWAASKLYRDRYGSHSQVTVTHEEGLGERLRRARERVIEAEPETPEGAA